MQDSKSILSILAMGIGIGAVLTIGIIVFLGAKPVGINIGPVEFAVPTQIPADRSHPSPGPLSDSDQECVHPQMLAQQRGWVDKGWTSDQWGGWYVELSRSDDLPPMWEALGERHIYQTDSDRTMSPGRWAIYTPYACREEFGFSQ